jgi:hypothetical protein
MLQLSENGYCNKKVTAIKIAVFFPRNIQRITHPRTFDLLSALN